MEWTHQFALCILVCASLQVSAQMQGSLFVFISLDTPGPPHQAATWIQLTCLAPFVGSSVIYNWTFHCTHSGHEPVSQSPSLGAINDEPTIAIKSTPTGGCLDTAVCTALDQETGSIGQDVWTVGSVTGIGLWGNQPIDSHTAFEADSNGQIGTIYCHSSSNETDVGQWFAPDGHDLTNDILDIFSTGFFSGADYYSYSTLEVLTNHQFTVTEQGAYTCQAPDSNGILQKSTLWIFPINSFPRYLNMTFIGRTSMSPFTLNCNTAGLPPTSVVWRRDSETLTSGGRYQISQSYLSNYTLNFTNNLVIDQSFHQVTGIYSCFVISILQKPLTNTYERFDASHYLGVYSLGSLLGINCQLSGVSIVLIQWEAENGALTSNSTQLSGLVTDNLHHLTYYCQGYDISNLLVNQLKFTFVVNVPESTLAVQPVTNPNPPVIGSEFTLNCRAAITANHHALASQPVPNVYYQNGSVVQSGFGITVIGPRQVTQAAQELQIEFDHLRTSHAKLYLCRALLESPALESPLSKESQIQLTLKLPQPSLILSVSHPPPYYAGSRVTLTCQATANPYIDTSIQASFNWTKDGVTISTSDTVTITNEQVGQVHQSVLSISQLDREQENGLYQCSVQLSPDGLATDQYLLASETTNITVQLDVIVQSLLTTVAPLELNILDVSPHNVISISCTATDVDETTVGLKSFAWRKAVLGSSSAEELINGIGTVTITNTHLEAPSSSSVLVTSESVPGTYEYTCESVQLSTDNTTLLATGNATSSVRVKGPANPAQVTSVSATPLSFSTARIMWTVSVILYTQETYTVLFQAQRHLSQEIASTAVLGTADLSAVNRVYSVTLQGLEEGVTYNYRIRSRNTVGRITDSSLKSFEIENSPVITSLYASDTSSLLTAGQNFTLVCEAVEHEGTLGMPSILWFDGNNQSVSTSEQRGISLHTSVWNNTHIISLLTFQQLTVALSQEYSCRIEFAMSDVVRVHRYILHVNALNIPVEIGTSNTSFVASHPLALTCKVATNQTDPVSVPIGALTYSWQSDCRGDCFTENQSMKTVFTQALKSADTGTHTCIVTDSVGNVGNASISLSITGIGMHSDVAGTLANNSYIVIGSGDLGMLQCLSGSAQTSTGQWIAPNGDNFTSSGNHPFRVVKGGADSPGSLEISLIPGEQFTTSEWLGVYSCRILNEHGFLDTFHLGIYVSSPPAVTVESLELQTTTLYSVFTLNCSSTGSAPSTVQWYKDNELITLGLFYDTVQILRDGTTSTYDNLLLISSSSVSEVLGTYRCEVSNDLSIAPSLRIKNVQGLRIFADTETFALGSTVSITCSTDLRVSSIEWLREGRVVESSSGDQALLLVVRNVTESDHNKRCVCRAFTNHFGIVEKTFVVQVEVTEDDLTISITQSHLKPILGSPFSIHCTVTKNTWLTSNPTVEWFSMGNRLTSDNLPDGNSIQVEMEGDTVASTLSFTSLNQSDSGEFECVAEIVTSALPGVIRQSADWTFIEPVPTIVPPTIKGTPCTMMIQLLLSEVQNCQDYRFVDQAVKVNSIISSVVRNINRGGYTACSVCAPLTVDDFTEPTFDCDSSQPTSVLFRVTIKTNGSCDDIRVVLTDWVRSGAAAVTINFNTLRVNSYCPVEIMSDSPFPNCDSNPGTLDEGSVAIIGGGAGAGVAVLVFVVILIVCIVCCLRRRKKRLQSQNHIDHPRFQRESASSVNMYEGSYRSQHHGIYPSGGNPAGPHKTLPPLPPFRPNRASTDSYICMNPIKQDEMVTDYYDDASCKKELANEVYDEIPGQYYEAVYCTPTESDPSVSTFKQVGETHTSNA